MKLFHKKPTLKAITKDPDLAQMFPIVPAKDALPSWYKDMPLTYERGYCPVHGSPANMAATIKGCYGVNQILRAGFIIPAAQDISIIVNPDGSVGYRGSELLENCVSPHSSEQSPPTFGKCAVVKIIGHWFIESDTRFLFTGVPYHNSLAVNYFVPSAITEFKNQHETNFFLALPIKSEPYEVFIRAGQPLIHLIPLTDDPVKLEVVYDPDYKERTLSRFFMIHGYNRGVNALKRFKEGKK